VPGAGDASAILTDIARTATTINTERLAIKIIRSIWEAFPRTFHYRPQHAGIKQNITGLIMPIHETDFAV
jgi:hypothetical protein